MFVQTGDGTRVQYSLVQMGGEISYTIHLLCNLCRWWMKHSTIFICFATFPDDIEQMRSKTQCNNQ